MQEVTLIPAIRFPEFHDEWVKKTIKSVSSKITDGTHDTPKPTKEGVPYLTAIHVKDGFIDFENCYFLPQEVHNKIFERCNPEYGDLLMVNIGAGTATSAMVNVDFEFSLKNVALIKPNPDIINNELFAQIQRRNSGRLRHQISAGGAQPFLSLKEIAKLKLSIPTNLPEQQKIASFLTALDERIQLLQKKKAKLEEFKKGLMQKLFSQEIRFKDHNGNGFPDWEEKKLGEIGATFNGLTGKTRVDFGEGMPYVQYMQIFSNSKINVQEFGFVRVDENENQSKVQYGDVFFTTSSETPNEIGTASVMLEEVGDVYLNSFCFGFRPNSLKELVPQFSRYLFRSELFRREVIKLAQGSTRFNMSKVELMKLPVLLPKEEEQNKIADFLTSLDDSIESIGVEIEGSIEYKKGLLQKMFV